MRGVFFLIGSAILTLLIVSLPQEKNPLTLIERPIGLIISPVQKGVTSLWRGGSHLWDRYIALVRVGEENRLLRREIARVEEENNQLREEREMNKRLTRLLEFKKASPFTLEAAQVIGRAPTNWSQAVIIDKGSRDGLAVDMGVITPSGAVGRIMKTTPTFSYVLLLVDHNSGIPALAQRTRDEGIVEGIYRKMATLKYIPPVSDIQAGDVIVTSGATGSFPKGVMIGRVSRVEKPAGELFLQAEVIPEVDFLKLEEVFVITSPFEPLEKTG